MADGHVKWFLGNNVSPGMAASTPNDNQNLHSAAEGWLTAAGTSSLSDAGGNKVFAVTFSPI
jgi:hypothetical protein